jgi:hypothetical protein
MKDMQRNLASPVEPLHDHIREECGNHTDSARALDVIVPRKGDIQPLHSNARTL